MLCTIEVLPASIKRIVCLFQLLGNILSWHGILSDRVLRELALDGLLNRYVMLALINSPPGKESIEKCNVVSDRLLKFPSEYLDSQSYPLTTIRPLRKRAFLVLVFLVLVVLKP